MADKAKKNSLSIRLTESAVFLRSDGAGRRRGGGSRPSMLRGLLTLDLAKPTRITSIELELQAKSVTAWPEGIRSCVIIGLTFNTCPVSGIGARRAEVTEEHRIFQASTVYFQAKKFQTRRNASVGPGAACSDDEGVYDWQEQPAPSSAHWNQDGPTTGREPPSRDTSFLGLGHENRRLSADSSFFQRVPVSHEDISTIATPTYSPFATHPSSPSSERPPTVIDSTTNHAALPLEDFRNSLNAGLRNHRSEYLPVTMYSYLIFRLKLCKVDPQACPWPRLLLLVFAPSAQTYLCLVGQVLRMCQRMNLAQALHTTHPVLLLAHILAKHHVLLHLPRPAPVNIGEGEARTSACLRYRVFSWTLCDQNHRKDMLFLSTLGRRKKSIRDGVEPKRRRNIRIVQIRRWLGHVNQRNDRLSANLGTFSDLNMTKQK